MRVETDEYPPVHVDVATAYRPPIKVVSQQRRRIDRFDLSVLAVFALVSAWVLGVDLWQVIINGRVWTGTDGLYLVDQLQYAAWIRDASHQVLVSNLFVLHPTPADYFQPAIVISGGLTALGVAPWLSLLLWKPVAVGAAFYVIRAYVRRSLNGLWSRRSALVLALFFGSFTVLYGSVTTIGDLFPGFLSWGYVFALMGLAAMVGGVLVYERSWTTGRWRWAPGVLGVLASLLHPWNGEMLVAVVLGAEAVMWVIRRRPPRSFTLPLQTTVLTVLPLLYYAILGKTDPSWEMARDASRHTFSLLAIVIAIAPLLIPALLAYRRRPDNFLAAATRFWPLAAVAVFVLSGTAADVTPLHAFQGITIPLAVLAVEGIRSNRRWWRVRRPRLVAAIAIAIVTIPATVFELSNALTVLEPAPGQNANFITQDEQSALSYLAADRTPGGVLTRSYLGAVVPEATGRHTLIGDCLWSQPDCYTRTDQAQALFDGSLTPVAARQYVLSTRARFVLSDCSSTANLGRSLGPIVKAVHEFGCATVYEVS